MKFRSYLFVTTVVGALYGMPAHAQGAATQSSGVDPASQGIDDIVVTARRMEESLQTTPVAVTALSAVTLDRAQVVNVQDLQRIAPSLVVSTGSASTSGYAFISIRGQGNLTPLISNDPAVAAYIDGVYVPRPSQGLTDMHDMQRVEILRGPQGTLFGRNTTGGALNLLSKDPVDHFEGSVHSQIGNYDEHEIGGMINAPITENLAVRAVYNFREHDGYGRSAFLNRDLADIRSHFARGKIKYTGAGFDLTLSADYNRITDKSQLTALSGFNPAAFAGPLAAYAPLLASSLHSKDVCIRILPVASFCRRVPSIRARCATRRFSPPCPPTP